MDFDKFCDWLMATKGFSERGSHDAASRLRRVQKYLGVDTIDMSTYEAVKNNQEYIACNVSTRSQMKRAISSAPSN